MISNEEAMIPEDEAFKDAPLWAKLLLANQNEIYAKFEVYSAEVAGLKEEQEKRDEAEVEDEGLKYEPEDLVEFIEENERLIDELIDLMKETTYMNGVQVFNYLSMPSRKRSMR